MNSTFLINGLLVVFMQFEEDSQPHDKFVRNTKKKAELSESSAPDSSWIYYKVPYTGRGLSITTTSLLSVSGLGSSLPSLLLPGSVLLLGHHWVPALYFQVLLISLVASSPFPSLLHPPHFQLCSPSYFHLHLLCHHSPTLPLLPLQPVNPPSCLAPSAIPLPDGILLPASELEPLYRDRECCLQVIGPLSPSLLGEAVSSLFSATECGSLLGPSLAAAGLVVCWHLQRCSRPGVSCG